MLPEDPNGYGLSRLVRVALPDQEAGEALGVLMPPQLVVFDTSGHGHPVVRRGAAVQDLVGGTAVPLGNGPVGVVSGGHWFRPRSGSRSRRSWRGTRRPSARRPARRAPRRSALGGC